MREGELMMFRKHTRTVQKTFEHRHGPPVTSVWPLVSIGGAGRDFDVGWL